MDAVCSICFSSICIINKVIQIVKNILFLCIIIVQKELIARNVDNVTVSAEVNCSLVCAKFCVSYFAEQNDTRVRLLSCAVAFSDVNKTCT